MGYAAAMRSVSAVWLAAILACSGAPRRIQLRAWCRDSEGEPGDCLRLLAGGARPFTYYARYTVAMAMGWSSTLGPMKDELRGMVSARAIQATIVSAMAMYLMLWALPEPLSKGIAAGITVFLLGYLGLDGVLKLWDAWKALVDEADQAQDFEELRRIGDRFGARAGPELAKVVMLVATAAIGTAGGLAARGSSLPGFFQATLQAEAQGGIRLLAVGAIDTVVVDTSTVTIALGPGAVAMAASGRGSGVAPPRYTESNFRENLIKLSGMEPKDSHAHHVFPQILAKFFSPKGFNVHDPRYGAWWNARGHLQFAAEYNSKWINFFRLKNDPSQAEIVQFARDLADHYGFELYF